MHDPLLRARHRKHFPLWSRHNLQYNLPVRTTYAQSPPIPSAHSDPYQPLLAVKANLFIYRCFSFIILFLEVPLLLRVCPTSEKFDQFIRRFETNYMRAAIYLVMAVVQWVSLVLAVTSLVAAAVFLTIAAACYALAGFKGQGFVGSKTLGGHGVAQMIV